MQKEIPIIEECIEALSRAPLMFGIRVFESYAMAQNGRIPVPDEDEKEVSRHAFVVYGYSREDRCFYFRDTYLGAWGSFDGSLPFEYIEKGYVLEIGQITVELPKL
jgi:hypothetical protein